MPVLALAQIAERGAALSVDLKTQLLAVINAPPAGTENTGDLIPAASSALSAITAVQINAAQAMNATPQTMAFTLPMWLGSGYAQAHIAVDRDAPEPGGKRSLDGDNFHIAFILDTKNLGTVAVDLQTVGRAFSLAVKTENETTAKRFADALDDAHRAARKAALPRQLGRSGRRGARRGGRKPNLRPGSRRRLARRLGHRHRRERARMNSNNAYYNARRNAPERPAAAALYYDPAGAAPPEIIATGRGHDRRRDRQRRASSTAFRCTKIRDWSKRSPNSTSAR